MWGQCTFISQWDDNCLLVVDHVGPHEFVDLTPIPARACDYCTSDPCLHEPKRRPSEDARLSAAERNLGYNRPADLP